MTRIGPVQRTTAVLLAMAVAGFVAIILSWRGSAATLDVWLQLPFLMSGAFVGAGLIGAGLGLLSIHLDRAEAAEESADLDVLIQAVEHLAR